MDLTDHHGTQIHTKMQSHAAHTGELRCTEQQVTSLKITEGNPAQDPSQNETGRSAVIRTTIIQATGCNFRVSTETTKFDVVIFFFFFFLHSVSNFHYGITLSYWLGW